MHLTILVEKSGFIIRSVSLIKWGKCGEISVFWIISMPRNTKMSILSVLEEKTNLWNFWECMGIVALYERI